MRIDYKLLLNQIKELSDTKYIESALGDKLTAKKYPMVNLLVKWHDASAPTMDRIIKELSTDELSEYFRDKKINIF